MEGEKGAHSEGEKEGIRGILEDKKKRDREREKRIKGREEGDWEGEGGIDRDRGEKGWVRERVCVIEREIECDGERKRGG